MGAEVITEDFNRLEIDSDTNRWVIANNVKTFGENSGITVRSGYDDLRVDNFGDISGGDRPALEISSSSSYAETRFVNREGAQLTSQGWNVIDAGGDELVFDNRGVIDISNVGDGSLVVAAIMRGNSSTFYNSGSLKSQEVGISLEGYFNFVKNTGYLDAGYIGVIFGEDSNDSQLYNSGTIKGGEYAVIVEYGSNGFILKNTGTIIADAAISMSGENTLVKNSGTILGGYLNEDGFYGHEFYAVRFTAGSVGSQLINTGTISATPRPSRYNTSDYAEGVIEVGHSSDGFRLKNYGEIKAYSDSAALSVFKSDDVRIDNYGEIDGTDTITIFEGDRAIINNRGFISFEENYNYDRRGSAAIFLGDTTDAKIINSGTIDGGTQAAIAFLYNAETTNNKVYNKEGGIIKSGYNEYSIGIVISGSDGTEDIKNDGHIDGYIELGGGLDYYRGSGTINGAVYGEGGGDRFYGAESGEEFHGGDDRDILRGRGGDDMLFGDDGADFLVDGFGSDMMEGGEGVDKFIFAGLDSLATDTITDFADNEDRLDLRLTGLTDLAAVALHLENDADGNAVFTADSGNVLIIENITVVDLLDDIII